MRKSHSTSRANGALACRRTNLGGIMVVLWALAVAGVDVRGVAAASPAPQDSAHTPNAATAASLNQLFGTIRAIDGAQLTVESRDHRMIKVDASAAIKSYRTIVLVPGRTVSLLGRYDDKGVLVAQAIQRAKKSREVWPPDR